MKYLFDSMATTNDIDSHFDLLSCFLNTASLLPAIAADEQKKSNPAVTKEISNGHLIITFYLFRHSLELALKALIKETIHKDIHNHDPEDMWNMLPQNYRAVLSEKMEPAISALKEYSVLKNEELFRYHINKGGVTLKNLSAIKNEDFDALSSAAWIVRHAYLCCMHLKKGLPPEKDNMCDTLYLLENQAIKL